MLAKGKSCIINQLDQAILRVRETRQRSESEEDGTAIMLTQFSFNIILFLQIIFSPREYLYIFVRNIIYSFEYDRFLFYSAFK